MNDHIGMAGMLYFFLFLLKKHMGGMIMEGLCSTLIGYLIGCINPAYIAAKHKGFDIRKSGSGNAGASNAVITMGKGIGAVSAFCDIFKAVLAVKIVMLLFPKYKLAWSLAATSCILGHIFPCQMNFRGGKGLACLAGIVLAYNWRVFLVLFACALLVALLSNYICFITMGGAIVFPFIYGYLEHSLPGTLVLLAAAVIIIYKHIENLRRIRNGTEAHISFLWKRKEEIERIKHNHH